MTINRLIYPFAMILLLVLLALVPNQALAAPAVCAANGEYVDWNTSTARGISSSAAQLPDFSYTLTGHVGSATETNSEIFQDVSDSKVAIEDIYGEANSASNLNVRFSSGTHREIVLTLNFDTATPTTNWSFAVLDLDVEQVFVAAVDSNGNAVPSSTINTWFDGAFDANPSDGGVELGGWSNASSCFYGSEVSNCSTGASVGSDSEASGFWMSPTTSLNSLTLRVTSIRDLIPSIHTYVASCLTPPNTVPNANNDSLTVVAGSSGNSLSLLANDSDADGHSLTVDRINSNVLTAGGSASSGQGTVTKLANGSLRYTPGAGYSGLEMFSYRISDGHGGTDMATVSVTVSNIPPQANNDSTSLNKNTSNTLLQPLSNDTDADGHALQLSQINGVAVSAGSTHATSHGSLTVENDLRGVRYTPTTGYDGSDSFSYQIADGYGGVRTATYSLTVVDPNNAPSATNDSLTVVAGSGATVLPLLANDTDADGDSLTVDRINGSAINPGGSVTTAQGLVAMLANGTLRYTPRTATSSVNGFSGTETFTYRVSDGNGGTDTASVSATATNHSPQAHVDTPSVIMDTSNHLLQPLSNDTDSDGHTLYLAEINGAVVSAGSNHGTTNGAITVDNDLQRIRYTPNASYHGSDSFTYRATDRYGATHIATVTITVVDPNTPPVASNDSLTVVAGSSATPLPLLANDSDADGHTLNIDRVNGHGITPGNTVSTSQGSVTMLANGTVQYTPRTATNSVNGFSGTETFTYRITDGHGGTSSATVTATSTNHAPWANVDSVALTVNSGSNVLTPLSNDTDADGHTLFISEINDLAVTGGSSYTTVQSTVVVDNDLQRLHYTPPANYIGVDSFTYRVMDRYGATHITTVTINIALNAGADTDGDGIPDSVEYGSNPLARDTDGDGIPDFQDLDSDNDGIADALEAGPTPATPRDRDNDAQPDYLDLDSDNDGLHDIQEVGGSDSNHNGQVDGMTDSNSNGWHDALESTPWPDHDSDGDGLPDRIEQDSDADGIPDTIETAQMLWDTDSDGQIDGSDTDHDGILDLVDGDQGNFGDNNSVTPLNTDHDGLPDYRDRDSDQDGISDQIEVGSTPQTPLNSDSDNRPNYLDLDSDNDGINDIVEAGGNDSDHNGLVDSVQDSNSNGWHDPFETTPLSDRDTDLNGVPDRLSIDSDGDGMFDLQENFWTHLDGDNNGQIDGVDTDVDGIIAAVDGHQGQFGDANVNILVDTDQDGVADYRDRDSDNDGVTDQREVGSNPRVPRNSDNDGLPDYRDLDADNDSLHDLVEAGGSDIDGNGLVDNLTDSNGDGLHDSYALSPLPDSDTDGDTLPNRIDPDSDADGIFDLHETLGSAVDPDNDGQVSGIDNDQDGIVDSVDNHVGWGDDGDAQPVDTDQDGQVDYLDIDSDNDGVGDGIETLQDPDQDGIPNMRDTDSDNDGLADGDEAGNADSDGDTIPDLLDIDSDNDTILDAVEGDRDTDGDGRPDYLDLDSDNDGIHDLVEARLTIEPLKAWDTDQNGQVDNQVTFGVNGFADPLETVAESGIPSEPLRDHDSDGLADFNDLDSDNDSLHDALESDHLDTNRDGKIDTASSVDTWGRAAGAGKWPRDWDKDKIADFRDLDTDNDGVPDLIEVAGEDENHDGRIDNFVDSDRDGVDDSVDNQLALPLRDHDYDGVVDIRDLDSDNDGLSDLLETGGNDQDGSGVIQQFEDTNHDGLDDRNVLQPPTFQDPDNDQLPRHLDLDSDNDGIFDIVESGKEDNNQDGQVDALSDADRDSIPDSVDVDFTGGEDSDNDSIDDRFDFSVRRMGVDVDGDDIIDAFDPERDGDGYADAVQSLPGFTPNLPDTDADGIPDVIDPDTGVVITSVSGSGGGGAIGWVLCCLLLGGYFRRRSALRVSC